MMWDLGMEKMLIHFKVCFWILWNIITITQVVVEFIPYKNVCKRAARNSRVEIGLKWTSTLLGSSWEPLSSSPPRLLLQLQLQWPVAYCCHSASCRSILTAPRLGSAQCVPLSARTTASLSQGWVTFIGAHICVCAHVHTCMCVWRGGSRSFDHWIRASR